MTGEVWLACDDLAALPALVWRRATDRKALLFAVACCRRIWHLLADERSRHAVDVAERFADGRASVEELFDARDAALKALDFGYRTLAPGAKKHVHTAHLRAAWDTAALCITSAWEDEQAVAAVNRREMLSIAHWASSAAAHAAVLARRKGERDADWDELVRAETAAQVALFRDVFGGPFRPVALDPAWLAWDGGTAAKMARAVYEEARFEDLPLLADALEEAGCTDADILGHCRGPGPHARGCWAVDVLLGRQ